jgi:predicted acyltransferase
MTTTAPTPEMTSVPAPQEIEAPKPAVRLVSLDALRGFDMFWIIGADNLVLAICAAIHKNAPNHPTADKWASVIGDQMDHVLWRGFHFYDLIFPMFVFIVGASLVFSLSKAIERGGKGRAIRRIIIRGIVLYLFGIIYYGGLGLAFGGNFHRHHIHSDAQSAFARIIADIRFMGVLQRIAICYTIAGLLFCFFRARVLAGVAAGLLLLYWGLLVAIHPGQPKVSYDENQNLANYVDVHYLPGFKWDGDHDPEGLLSTIPAVGGCLLGVLAGVLLKTPKLGAYQKAGILVAGGAVFILIGMVWGGIPLTMQDGGWTLPEAIQFPVIKKIWTSSFVMLTAGCASVLLGLFYLVIDVWKQRWIVTPFIWIGMNAITLYLIWHFTDEMKDLSATLFGYDDSWHSKPGGASELAHHLWPHTVAIAQPAIALLLILLIARFLYKRQIFLRV